MIPLFFLISLYLGVVIDHRAVKDVLRSRRPPGSQRVRECLFFPRPARLDEAVTQQRPSCSIALNSNR